ncbi:MAG: EcsC family protein [Alphaproteobacteria bacterium]|nr:EcsC family protein [Alphaproteobacteria bacterium]
MRLLERTSLTGRLSRIIGERAGGLGALIPAGGRKVVALAVDAALYAAMRTALRSLRGRRMRPAHFHKSIASLSGAAGGAFGFAALPVELPVSTVLMLRAIADTARAEGEDLDDTQTRMACMEVFALGGRTPDDDALDSAYFAMRAVLAQTVSAAAQYAAAQGAAKDSAPIIVKLISLIATRFGIAVSQKAAAQAVPVIGALAGAGINYAFMSHFQGLARGHFTVRRLERAHGEELVRAEYLRLKDLLNGEAARGGR